MLMTAMLTNLMFLYPTVSPETVLTVLQKLLQVIHDTPPVNRRHLGKKYEGRTFHCGETNENKCKSCYIGVPKTIKLPVMWMIAFLLRFSWKFLATGKANTQLNMQTRLRRTEWRISLQKEQNSEDKEWSNGIHRLDPYLDDSALSLSLYWQAILSHAEWGLFGKWCTH